MWILLEFISYRCFEENASQLAVWSSGMILASGLKSREEAERVCANCLCKLFFFWGGGGVFSSWVAFPLNVPQIPWMEHEENSIQKYASDPRVRIQRKSVNKNLDKI